MRPLSLAPAQCAGLACTGVVSERSGVRNLYGYLVAVTHRKQDKFDIPGNEKTASRPSLHWHQNWCQQWIETLLVSLLLYATRPYRELTAVLSTHAILNKS